MLDRMCYLQDMLHSIKFFFNNDEGPSEWFFLSRYRKKYIRIVEGPLTGLSLLTGETIGVFKKYLEKRIKGEL